MRTFGANLSSIDFTHKSAACLLIPLAMPASFPFPSYTTRVSLVKCGEMMRDPTADHLVLRRSSPLYDRDFYNGFRLLSGLGRRATLVGCLCTSSRLLPRFL